MSEINVPDGYQAVPVDVARQISEAFGKSMVVILGVDSIHDMFHVTTYGTSALEKEMAANVGEALAKQFSEFELRRPFEDYRYLEEGKQVEKIERLKEACRAADNILAWLLGDRHSVSDNRLRNLRDALQEALK